MCDYVCKECGMYLDGCADAVSFLTGITTEEASSLSEDERIALATRAIEELEEPGFSMEEILREIAEELWMCYPSIFADDIEKARMKNIQFGLDLAKIQNVFSTCVPLRVTRLLYIEIERQIKDYLVDYEEFHRMLRRGAIPHRAYIPQDVNVKFDITISESDSESDYVTVCRGTAMVDGSHGNMNHVLGHAFDKICERLMGFPDHWTKGVFKTDGQMFCIPAGSYIPTWTYASLTWDPQNKHVEILI